MDSNLDLVMVCFLTYLPGSDLEKKRTAYAVSAIETLAQFTRGVNLGIYLADSGSQDSSHCDTIKWAIQKEGLPLIGSHSLPLDPGENWTMAIEMAHKESDFLLWLEDDWRMRGPMDLSKYVRALKDRPSYPALPGMIRLGHIPIDLSGDTVGFEDTVYLQIDYQVPYAYSGNPSLRHRRFFDAYGGYPAGKSPGDCELALDSEVRMLGLDGPKIWWPFDIGQNGGWSHIGTERSYDLDPDGRWTKR